MQSLVNFPKEAINDETVELLQVGPATAAAAGKSAPSFRPALPATRPCPLPSSHSPHSPASSPLASTHPVPPPLHASQPYFSAPDFNFEAAKKASGNVAGLCNWARSMCKYHEVAKVGAREGTGGSGLKDDGFRWPRWVMDAGPAGAWGSCN